MLVQTETLGASVWLTINRPERANALSAELVDALLEALNEALRIGPKVLVLQGTGKSFCGGFDLTALERESDASLAYRLLRIELLLQALYSAPCYTLALAHGTVAGAGADLVTACHRRIGAPSTRFRFPGIRFGIVLGTRRLVELVGREAYSVILEQRTVEAEQAVQLGLLSELLPPSKWRASVAATEQTIAGVPRTAVDLATQAKDDHGASDRDMGLLARSLLEPGLQQRILAFRTSVQRPAKAEQSPH